MDGRAARPQHRPVPRGLARPHPLLLKLGRRITELRKEKGLSQEDLAHVAGVDRSYMSCIERGVRNPSVLKLAVIARALNVSVADLFSPKQP